MNRGIIRNYENQLDFLRRVVDGLIIMLMCALAVIIYSPSWSDKYAIVAISAVILFQMSARIHDLYKSYRASNLSEEFSNVLKSWMGAIAGLLFIGYAFKGTHELSRVVLGIWAIGTPLVMLGWRHLYRLCLKKLRIWGYNTRSTVIVGVNDDAKHLAMSLLETPWTGLRLIGFIAEDASGEVFHHGDQSWSVIGNHDQLATMARQGDIDRVYLAYSLSDSELIDGVLEALGDSTVSIYLIPSFYEAEIMQGRWVTLGDTPTIAVIDSPTPGIDSAIKRSLDFALSLLLITAVSIPLVFIAIGVKLSSPGPVFYRQRRYGLAGKPIDVCKFRSMYVTEADSEFRQARMNDSRVTSFGALLRRTSLDELPQLFNVLEGSMSLVGPRPHAVAHNEEYRGKITGYMLRHKAKPGMTGLAQINGCRGETDTPEKMENRVRYDVEYINNWSVIRDLGIMLKTPLALLRDKNAY